MAGVDPKQFQSKEPSRIPGATYRFQFHREFPLTKATEVVDYLSELGITDLYSSPLLKARPGSTHGYDCVDHSKLNDEIGSIEQFATLSDSLKKKGK
jgi:(1->4)-alpha-D-glucan 1-alpha-D-glucosylmutase